ncbi:uncharacterized protein LAESUDRAFT_781914 [Laetiporus sulphureus 93-53]|uniref:C2H2-type domain-containing protein n=1 Tax=Laetiporus sulphureus 93-53 TaxID=1314785 RepID=A0A165DHF2_9APHY|nr:uncharacterized protein LAESUDRAFT_781914 [Laetiporus sulphureus 93-53]KZT04886.1 hypothetical protein LAESUDRAFT_781914 [Laetiporus sulphureus 93-53]
MSYLSLPIEELIRLRVSIRVLESGGFAFNLQPSSSDQTGNDDKSRVLQPSYSVKIEASEDKDGHVLRIFAVCDVTSPQNQDPLSNKSPFESTTSGKSSIPGNVQYMSWKITCRPTRNIRKYHDGHARNVTTTQDTLYAQLLPHDDWSFTDLEMQQIVQSMCGATDPDRRDVGAATYGEVLASQESSARSSATTLVSTPASPSSPATERSTSFKESDCEGVSRTSHKGGRRNHQCPHCARRCTSEYTLQTHVRSHRPKAPKSLPCTMGCTRASVRVGLSVVQKVLLHRKDTLQPCMPDCRAYALGGIAAARIYMEMLERSDGRLDSCNNYCRGRKYQEHFRMYKHRIKDAFISGRLNC